MDKSKWEYKKLGEVATFLNGYAFKPDNWSEHGLKIIRIQNLTDETALYNCYNGDIDPKYIVHKGDLLISWSATLGAFIWNNDDALLNQHIFKTIFDKSDIDKFYLRYCVISRLEEFSKKAHGITMRHITKKDFDNTIIPVPFIADQQRIVAELDCLNEMISLKQEQLKEFDKLAQSIFYDMFGDPVTNEKGWDRIKLGDICTCITKGTTPTTLGFPFVEEGVNFVKVESFVDGKIAPAKLTHITNECNLALSRSQLENEDLLVCIAGATIGKMAFVDTSILPANTNQACAIIRLKEKKNLRFIHSFLTLKLKNDIIQMGKGVAQPNLSLGQLRDFMISFPPLALQQQFAEKIQAIEAQKELVKKSIAETQQLLDSRMDYYFD